METSERAVDCSRQAERSTARRRRRSGDAGDAPWMDRTAFRAVIENERTILLAETESMCNAESEVLRQADKSISGHYAHHGESIHLERHRLLLGVACSQGS
jgi:hypothetical protein